MVSEGFDCETEIRFSKSLNPYCSGIWSRRGSLDSLWQKPVLVLILIVVEYGLGVYIQKT